MPRVTVFDSGAGGLTVAAAIRARLPEAELVYLADTAGFPYGGWSGRELAGRIGRLMDRVLPRVAPDVAVIACNTASTLVLKKLRRRFATVFVGTVPAIKPAARTTRSGIVGVLATKATAERDYTRALIRDYAGGVEVIVHVATGLAGMAEAKLAGEVPARQAVREAIAPVFATRAGRRTDTVVLGCTHYPLLMDELRDAAPWPVAFVDPAEAIARRVAEVLVEGLAAGRTVEAGTALFTGPVPSAGAMADAYAARGFTRLEPVPGFVAAEAV